METRKVKELGTMSFKQKYDGHDVDLLSIKIRSDPNNQNSFHGNFAMNKKDQALISYFVRSDDGIDIKDELEKIAYVLIWVIFQSFFFFHLDRSHPRLFLCLYVCLDIGIGLHFHQLQKWQLVSLCFSHHSYL